MHTPPAPAPRSKPSSFSCRFLLLLWSGDRTPIEALDAFGPARAIQPLDATEGLLAVGIRRQPVQKLVRRHHQAAVPRAATHTQDQQITGARLLHPLPAVGEARLHRARHAARV